MHFRGIEWVLAASLICGSAIAQDSDPVGSAEAVGVALDVERTMLKERLRQRNSHESRRTEMLGVLGGLYREIEAELGREEGIDPEKLDPLAAQLRQVGSDLATILDAERQVLEAISDGRRRVTLLEQQFEQMLDRQEPRQVGLLSGRWGVILMPTGQRGTWSLRQDGTIVTGTYRLDGGWTGSLQGTLVDRKLFLVRIDSKLGRVMEFEGHVSGDAARVRGTFLNYEMAGSAGATGQWSAQREESGP